MYINPSWMSKNMNLRLAESCKNCVYRSYIEPLGPLRFRTVSKVYAYKLLLTSSLILVQEVISTP